MTLDLKIGAWQERNGGDGEHGKRKRARNVKGRKADKTETIEKCRSINE